MKSKYECRKIKKERESQDYAAEDEKHKKVISEGEKIIEKYFPELIEIDKSKIRLYVLKYMNKYAEMVNTPPKTYQEYLDERQKLIDFEYDTMCSSALDVNMYDEAIKLEKLYLNPKLRKVKLNKIKGLSKSL